MKKLMVAMVAGIMSLAFASAYAADDTKGKDKKDTTTKTTKDDSKKKKDSK
jgi:hypothetical protein